MPYRRRFTRRRSVPIIVQRIKNQVNTDLSLGAASTTTFDAIQSVNVGAATKITGIEVPVGAMVKAVQIWVISVSADGAATGTVAWYYGIARQGQSETTEFPAPQFTAIGLSGLRNQIIHSDTTVIGTENAGPYRTKVMLRIPKIYQRIRSGDKHFIKFFTQTGGATTVAFLYLYYQ